MFRLVSFFLFSTNCISTFVRPEKKGENVCLFDRPISDSLLPDGARNGIERAGNNFDGGYSRDMLKTPDVVVVEIIPFDDFPPIPSCTAFPPPYFSGIREGREISPWGNSLPKR